MDNQQLEVIKLGIQPKVAGSSLIVVSHSSV